MREESCLSSLEVWRKRHGRSSGWPYVMGRTVKQKIKTEKYGFGCFLRRYRKTKRFKSRVLGEQKSSYCCEY